ncbi:hypothetical protein [Streptosporangium sp. NPDC001681]|uniref:hypothetical protein n=1 Tax=Streptosporangium sp. NPDC001681 TaxID=3154395 RepID=UPI00331B38E7
MATGTAAVLAWVPGPDPVAGQAGVAGTMTPVTAGQWLTCLAVGSIILWAGELVKALLRIRDRRQSAPRRVPLPADGRPQSLRPWPPCLRAAWC